MIKNKKIIVYLMIALSLFLLTGCMNSSGGGSKKLDEISEVKPYKVDGEVVISEEVEALHEDFSLALIQEDGTQVSTVELDKNGEFKFSSGKKLTVRPVSKKEKLIFEPEEVAVSSTETIHFKAVVQEDTEDNQDDGDNGEVVDDENTENENPDSGDTNQEIDSIVPEITDIPDQVVNEGENFNLQVQATDNISETLIYSASGLPEGSTINKNTGEINWDNTITGLYLITVFAIDEANNVGQSSFNLEVVGDELDLSISDAQMGVLAGGAKHSVALKADGGIVTWGTNFYGLLDDTPSENDFKYVAAANNHSLGIKTDGTVVGWGSDNSGQVSEVPDVDTLIQVAAGGDFSVGLTSIGTLEVWGGKSSYSAPRGNDFVNIAAGHDFILAIREDGSIDGKGHDLYNQISYIPSGNDFIQVAGGHKHGVALSSDGTIEAWGDDTYHQVSDAPTGNNFVQIASGNNHSMALKSDGSVVVWGSDSMEQISNQPTESEFVSIGSGEYHCLALRKDGKVVVWGNDKDGQVSEAPGNNDFKLN